METAIASLIVGLIIGYMGQRSRMCFIGGVRDFIIVRDTFLLKGFFGFLVTAIVMFMLLNSMGVYLKDYPWYNKKPEMSMVDYAIQTGQPYAACELPPQAIFGFAKEVRGISLGSFTLSYMALVTIIGSLSIGFFSTLANGCPFRQHVMAGSGNKSAWVYLLGFYAGIFVYNLFFHDFIKALTG